MKVVVTERAYEALAAIEDYVARDNPAAAVALVDRLLARARVLAQHPAIGRVVPEIANPDVRELVERGYRIVYRTRPGLVEVLTVFEGHRLLTERERDDVEGPP